MSKSCRGELVSKEMTKQPGPGEYDSPTRLGKDAPSVSFSYLWNFHRFQYVEDSKITSETTVQGLVTTMAMKTM